MYNKNFDNYDKDVVKAKKAKKKYQIRYLNIMVGRLFIFVKIIDMIY